MKLTKYEMRHGRSIHCGEVRRGDAVQWLDKTGRDEETGFVGQWRVGTIEGSDLEFTLVGGTPIPGSSWVTFQINELKTGRKFSLRRKMNDPIILVRGMKEAS